ncbi:MAG: efflux RND transporter permease subunit [Candidatus Margulisiibacteriota bacterium]
MIKNFVSKPLFTLSIYIIFVILGLYSFSRLPLDFLPNISLPTLTVITPYPGASPDDIETTVSKVIEDAVATVPNIDKISSDSIENLSTVTITFKWGADLDAAAADVRDKIGLVASKLPKDVTAPTLYKFDTSQIPVLVLGISAEKSYKELYHIADKTISPALKKIQGVGTVIISGGLERQINVEIDKNRLEAYHLSVSQVNMALASANLSLPAGSMKSGELEYGIRVPGEFSNIDQISDTVISSINGKEVYLSDVAEVKDYFKDPESFTEVNGKPGIMLMVQKQSGANTVQVADSVRKELVNLKKELPSDFEVSYVQDLSESINNSISELTTTLYWALLFVFLTVLFFLRNIRGAFIIGLAMPFSIIAAFIYMFLSGSSINIISLASIIISVGVVVDDAIVVLENIYRHKDKKNEPPREAAIYGTGEVSGAVLAATTTTLVIFIPLLLVQGFVGIFFNQLSIVSIVIISMSYIISMSLTPMLSSKLLNVNKKEKLGSEFFKMFYEKSEKWFEVMENAYKKTLDWAIKNRTKVIISCSLVFFMSLPLFMFTGSEFFPDMDSGLLTANIALPAGTRLEETSRIMNRMQERVKKEVPELEFILVNAGTGTRMSLSTKSGPNYGKIYIKILPLDKRKRGMKEIQKHISDIAASIPGLKSVDFAASGANQMAGSERPITLEIYGSDFDKMDQAAQDLKDKIEKVPGATDPLISREKSNPEYALKVDREKAAALGLTMYDAAFAARSYLYGTTATKYREDGDEYDIFVRLGEKNRKKLEDIKSVYVTTRTGANISLGNLVSVELRNAPQVIQRKNQQRLIVVDADYFGRSLGDVMGDINRITSKMNLPDGVVIKAAGNSQQMAESFRSLFVSLLLGIALIYLVMVAQFESFREPFIIMFAIPFAIVGVVWALFLTGYPFGVMSFIGLILVAGIAVKNSIVLVDFTNILRARGYELKEAILESGRTRLRPILMTSATTGLGLLPIIIGSGEGSGFWKNMAIAVLGGLIVSATISLVFVPVLYYIFESRLEKSVKREVP